jgi:dTDP-glucose 4,6-dehydratase
MAMRIVVTGGAGFIGSALVRHLVLERNAEVCTIDKLTYSGSLDNLVEVEQSAAHQFRQVDICDAMNLRAAVFDFAPDAIMHLAAETHVDRSIDDPSAFIQANVVGTFQVLEVAREFARTKGDSFRLLHVSTDEVYGTLGASDLFTEDSRYSPNSPYSASKAGSDHLARAWFETYRLPVLVTNCSNNYGPHQFPEKLIPLTILKALQGQPIPVYGDGRQIRDWLYVDDHVRGLLRVLERGVPGRTYNIGGMCERTNISVVETILRAVARRMKKKEEDFLGLIQFVADRPGHDRRYAIDAARMRDELDWVAQTNFDEGIEDTVAWYVENLTWCRRRSNSYSGQRLGIAATEARVGG